MRFEDAARDHAAAWFDGGGFRRELATLVAHPTESQDPRGAPHLLAYLEEAMIPMLDGMGFETRVHGNPAGAGPILTAARIEDPALPTILTYGHGDVIRAQEDRWRDGLAPFELREEGDRLYGRGTADNKGQHLINLRALDAVLAARGRLGFNVKVLIETGEENGSPGLRTFCAANRALLAADVLIASDGPRLVPDVPTIFTGARGGALFDLRVDLREGAHHSGNFGGLLADPAIVLAHALACITDARGRIRVPEWRPDSLTPRIREVLARLPAVEAGPALDADWGEADLSPAERVFGWNSFAVLAMVSGVPEAPVNAISGHARATCQLRFVVGTEVEDIVPALRRHLDACGFEGVRIVPAERGTFPATRLDPDHPWVRFAARALEAATGRTPHLLPNLGGSLPNDCFADVLSLPTIWVPHSYAGCNQHAPDEHVLRPLARDALLGMTGLFCAIARDGGPTEGAHV
ncbi:M20 family metallopeptidase [uncultured Jannaschia sp.]|uniref:M20 family metallopeptidase n=1 Tax=uncultured Jannaschia sp. TaxID=293347 RepID=UPI00260189FE|nr:M20 family metallopeptidase [uncultured Jannaschia sp.]